MAYNSFYMPSLENPHRMYKSQKKTVVNPILPNMGFNSKALCVVVFGTSTYGGFELDHLVAVQGV
jgi:hypothetical protein